MLIAATFVTIGFVANAVPIALLWRPLLIGVTVATVVQSAMVFRLGWIRGSFWACVAAGAISGMFVPAGAMVFVLALFGLVRSAVGREYLMAGTLVASGAATTMVAVLVLGTSQGAFDWEPLRGAPMNLQSGLEGPSIHVLLLDGYPRQDVLANAGFDNSPFLAAMRGRGFDVYADSNSSYDRTAFSLLSMLWLSHIEAIPVLWESPRQLSPPEEQRLVARALLDPPLFELLEQAGFHTRALTGSVVHVPFGGADHVSNAGTANNFELDTLQRTPLAGLLELGGFAAQQQRDQITETLTAFAEAPDGKSFTLAHVLAPHTPFVFFADGAPAPAPPCYPAVCGIFESAATETGWSTEEYRARMLGQMQHLNSLVLAAVDRLTEQDPEAVIVVMSDHGVTINPLDEAERFRNLLIARTPDHPGLFDSHPTSINVFPSLINAYLDARVERLPDTLYVGGRDPWLAVEPVSPSE